MCSLAVGLLANLSNLSFSLIMASASFFSSSCFSLSKTSAKEGMAFSN
jgi:hypothetical protein